MLPTMNIGDAARHSGVSAHMIRHYEKLRLLPKVTRSESGYRFYGEPDLRNLGFIQRARDLGFAIEDIGRLMNLWQNRRRRSGDVKRLVQRHLTRLEEKSVEIEEMRRALRHLATHCHGDDRPDCPIIENLALGAGEKAGPRRVSGPPTRTG